MCKCLSFVSSSLFVLIDSLVMRSSSLFVLSRPSDVFTQLRLSGLHVGYTILMISLLRVCFVVLFNV